MIAQHISLSRFSVFAAKLIFPGRERRRRNCALLQLLPSSQVSATIACHLGSRYSSSQPSTLTRTQHTHSLTRAQPRTRGKHPRKCYFSSSEHSSFLFGRCRCCEYIFSCCCSATAFVVEHESRRARRTHIHLIESLLGNCLGTHSLGWLGALAGSVFVASALARVARRDGLDRACRWLRRLLRRKHSHTGAGSSAARWCAPALGAPPLISGRSGESEPRQRLERFPSRPPRSVSIFALRSRASRSYTVLHSAGSWKCRR